MYRVISICLIEFTLNADLNGQKQYSKYLFIRLAFAVQTRKNCSSRWSKTAQDGNNCGDLLLFPV